MLNRTILILGGTRPALDLASALCRIPGNRVITSLAGRTRKPAIPAGELRVGGFGGVQALAAYLELEKIDVVIDATHPFANVISQNAAEAAHIAGVSRLLLQRPPWSLREGWQLVADLPAAADKLLPGARCFLTIGWQELGVFEKSIDMWFLVRMIDAPKDPLPLKHYEVVTGLPYADIEDEKKLFQTHRIDTLVTKNSGGGLGRAKLEAAHELGINVLMVERPETPGGDVVVTVEATLEWLRS